MRRCPPDPSLGHPVAFWKNTDYALFKNGVIATFTPGENEIEELGSHYDMFYYDSKMVTELDLSRPDIISKSELVLVDLRFKWAVTALIFFSALIFEQLSTNPIHNLQQILLRFIPSFNDQWAAILNILILLLMFSDYYITRLIFNHKNKHHTISITHNLRKNKIILTQYPGNLTQLTAIITQTTRLAVGIAFLMIGVGDSVVETTFTLVLGLTLMIVSLSLLIALLANDSSKSTFFAMYDHSKSRKYWKQETFLKS